MINPSEGPGGNNYRNNIATCDPTVIGPGTVLDVEPGNMIGPTSQGMNDLIALDPKAQWDPDLYGTGRGGVRGGCMEERCLRDQPASDRDPRVTIPKPSTRPRQRPNHASTS